MDGAYVQCPATHPETGQQCVKLANTHHEHMSSQARDVHCKRWYDKANVLFACGSDNDGYPTCQGDRSTCGRGYSCPELDKPGVT